MPRINQIALTGNLAQGTAVFITGHLHSNGTALEIVARHIQILDQEQGVNPE